MLSARMIFYFTAINTAFGQIQALLESLDHDFVILHIFDCLDCQIHF